MNSVIPRHIGFIMDGNGRWAKQRNKPRNYGHSKGADNVERVVTACFSRGVECVSLYAFSTENWSRPQAEVDKIMELFRVFIVKFTDTLMKNEIRFMISGDRSRLSPKLNELILSREKMTANFTKTLNIAINYGGKQEIVSAVNEIIKTGATKVTEEDFSKFLYTKNLPDIDLVVRTSGEMRLSNFFLWQTAYAELYFTEVLWPDFDSDELVKAIEWFNGRERRYGKIK